MHGQLRRTLRAELHKAIVNPWFIICLVIGIGFAVVESIQIIPMRHQQDAQNALYLVAQFGGNTPNSSYLNNLLVDEICSAARIFFMVAPLLIALANSWSLSSEMKSGYTNTVLVRESREMYYASKWMATFVAAGLVCAVPLIVSFIISCCFLPAYPIDPYDWTYVPMDYSRFLGTLFYENPLGFMVVRILLDAAMAGVWATFVQAISLVVKNRITLLVGSFVAMLATNVGSQMLYEVFGIVQGPALTLVNYLQGCAFGVTVWPGVMAVEMAVLLAVSIGLPWALRGRDVL